MEREGEVMELTLEQIREQIEPELQPWVDKYGSTLVKMTKVELMEWVATISLGNSSNAYAQIITRMEVDEVLEEWVKINNRWKEANESNKKFLDAQKEAIEVIVKVLLRIVRLMLGV